MIDLSRPTQSGATYEIELYRDDGQRLSILDRLESFVATRVISNVGAFSIVLPADIDSRWIKPEQQIWFWHRPPGGVKNLVFGGIVKQITTAINDAERRITINGPSYEWIQIARAFKTSLQSNETNSGHTLIRGYNGTNTTTPFAFWPVSGLTYVGDDWCNGLPTITLSTMSRQPILDWLIEACNYFAATGVPVFFEVMPTHPSRLEFRLYRNQPGRDLTIGQPGAITFGPEFGNFSATQLLEDYTNEINVIWKLVSGGGVINDGSTVTLGGAAYGDPDGRYASTMYALREGFLSISGNTQVASEAQQILKDNRPKKAITGTLKSVPGSVYGIDWQFGDKINVVFDQRIFEVIIRAVTFGIDNTGREILEAAVEIAL